MFSDLTSKNTWTEIEWKTSQCPKKYYERPQKAWRSIASTVLIIKNVIVSQAQSQKLTKAMSFLAAFKHFHCGETFIFSAKLLLCHLFSSIHIKVALCATDHTAWTATCSTQQGSFNSKKTVWAPPAFYTCRKIWDMRNEQNDTHFTCVHVCHASVRLLHIVSV